MRHTTNWAEPRTWADLRSWADAARETEPFAAWTGTEGADSHKGTSDADTLTGKGGADVLSGKGGADSVYGGDGNDDLTGGGGTDLIYGGAGNDTVRGGSGDTYLYGGDGQDRGVLDFALETEDLFFRVSNNQSTYIDVEGTKVFGFERIHFTGGSGDDLIIGGAGDDTIRGGAGDDALSGGEGPNHGIDLLDGGAGIDGADLSLTAQTADIVFAVDPTATITLADGTRLKSIERVTFASGAGDDTLDGGAYQDLLYGGGGNDSLTGGSGSDVLDGGAGNDWVGGGSNDLVLYGGTGVDMARLNFSSRATDLDFSVNSNLNYGVNVAGTEVSGFEQIDFRAGSGDDLLLGGTMNDTLQGGAGADTLSGGAGADKLVGGDGHDMFRFDQGHLAGDRVTDFDGNGTGAGDVLVFSGFSSSAYLTHEGTTWTIHDGATTETFTLNVSSLSAGDYVFEMG